MKSEILPSREYRIVAMDDRFALVCQKTGRVVFHLHYRECDIEMKMDSAVMCIASFVCFEPSS